jgi:hypothetical protein
MWRVYSAWMDGADDSDIEVIQRAMRAQAHAISIGAAALTNAKAIDRDALPKLSIPTRSEVQQPPLSIIGQRIGHWIGHWVGAARRQVPDSTKEDLAERTTVDQTWKLLKNKHLSVPDLDRTRHCTHKIHGSQQPLAEYEGPEERRTHQDTTRRVPVFTLLVHPSPRGAFPLTS